MPEWNITLLLWIEAWLMASGLMILTWFYYLRTQISSCVDVSWGLGITAVGLFFLHQAGWNEKSILMAVALVIWGLRLSGYLYWTRVKPKIIDPRYQSMVEHWKAKRLAYFLNYQLQALLLLPITVPFFVPILSSQRFLLSDALALALVVIGVIGETLADWQLHQFKKHPSGPVCQQGLWRYSRHPNYFFEWLTWVGFSVFVLPLPFGWAALISPVTLFIIMIFITGPITERHSLRRGQPYVDYKHRTSMFFPWFPKKG